MSLGVPENPTDYIPNKLRIPYERWNFHIPNIRSFSFDPTAHMEPVKGDLTDQQFFGFHVGFRGCKLIDEW